MVSCIWFHCHRYIVLSHYSCNGFRNIFHIRNNDHWPLRRITLFPCLLVPLGLKTLKTVLVHPKDKQEKKDLTECVYKVLCANCDKTYIGETGRKFGVRLQEHGTEVESKTGRTFTRSLRASSLTEPPTTQPKRTMSSTGLKRR